MIEAGWTVFQSALFFCAIIICMKLTVEINNQTKNRLDKKFISKVILETLKKAGVVFLLNKNISLSLAIVGKSEIKKLNRVYRKIDKVTDILSFPEYKNTADLKKERKNAIFLGELVICPSDIEEYSKKSNSVFKKELAKVISHGVLHLSGLCHGRNMFSIQEKISENF